jgi:superfamily I DNA/RNA helicase
MAAAGIRKDSGHDFLAWLPYPCYNRPSPGVRLRGVFPVHNHPAEQYRVSSHSRFLEGLNPPQRAAVAHTEGPVLVLAGAGSGKTRVITRRIAHIIATGLAKPGQVLAVTFTNKAAGEMRERVADLVGGEAAKEITISTFHAFCLHMLRRQITHLGYRSNFTIASESDSRTLIRRVTEELGVQNESFDTGTFQSAISLAKNTGETPETVKDRPARTANDEKYRQYISEVYTRYESALRAANSLDFDDLLSLTLRLWRDHPKVLAEARRQFKYVMVDEYQDTNAVQYELLHMLTGEHQNLFVVGDDDQAIYGWRGADVRNILGFERDFPKATVITMDQNYRSTSTILDAANHVIKNNAGRREKKLWSDLGTGRPIDRFIVADEDAEAKEALGWLQYIRGRTKAAWSDFAVLYRSNIQSRVFEVVFRQGDVPYTVFGGQDFFERAEVKDIISYLKVIANPRDEAAFLRVVNVPRRGVGDATLHDAHDICRTEGKTLGMAVTAMIERGMVAPKIESGLRLFLNVVQRYRQRFKARDGSLSDIVRGMVADIDYLGELQRTSRTAEQYESRAQCVETVCQAIQRYEEDAEYATLAGFLDASHLNGDASFNSKEERRDSVSLMTIHSAKGLEFPFVFIVGLEDGNLPHDRALIEGSLDEERRLFYVALTRGRKHVTVFEALSRVRHGREKMCKSSRFLEEIPEALLVKQIRASREMVEEKVAPPEPKKKPKPRGPRKNL